MCRQLHVNEGREQVKSGIIKHHQLGSMSLLHQEPTVSHTAGGHSTAQQRGFDSPPFPEQGGRTSSPVSLVHVPRLCGEVSTGVTGAKMLTTEACWTSLRKDQIG